MMSHELKDFPEASRGSARGESLEQLIELSHIWIWELDEDHRFCHCSNAVTQLLGYDPSELLGNTPDQLLFPDDLPSERARFESRRNAPAETIEREVRLRHRDGSAIYCLTTSIPILDESGVFRGLKGMDRDVSGWRRAVDRMHESEERFRALADGSFDGVLVHIDGVVCDANDAACRMWGYTRDELIGMTADQLAAKESHASVHEHIRNRLEKPYELTLVHKDGTRFPAESIARNVNYDGRQARISGYRDLTRQKQAEADLSELQNHLQSVIDAAPIILWSVDKNGVFTLSEGRGLQLLGLKPKEVVGHSALDLYKDQPAALRCILKGLEGKSGIENVEVDERVWTVNYVPQYGDDGHLKGVIGTSIDVTDFKRMEAERERLQTQLQHSQRMETVGTLAGGIAHDFNNILTPIIGYSELAISDLPMDSPVRGDIEHVMKGALRAKELVEQILTFSRQTGRKRDALQLHLIVNETLSLLRASLPTSIDIYRDIDSQAGTVIADPAQMHSVIMNLCTNAYHAMGDRGGSLSVKLRRTVITADQIANVPNLSPGQHLELSIADSGKGIDANTLDRIFEPFFTTKEVGKGTGLGLSVVHGIVHDHSGEITVESAPNKGSKFTIYLPVADVSVSKQVPDKPQLSGSGERILVVDDDCEVVNIVEKMLRRHGYSVMGYTNSLEALVVFRYYADSFDLVITDQIMPTMLGEELVTQIRRKRESLPIIMMTGYSDRIDKHRLEELGISELLLKPITSEELALAVGRTLQPAKTASQD